MIVFNKNAKELNIPRGLGNVAVDITSGSTDTIMLREVERMINEAVGRTVRESNEYTDAKYVQAKAYTDSAATKVDYNYVLDSFPNADDANRFFEWLDKFDEADYPKLRILHVLGVFQWQYGRKGSDLMFQAVDTTYMFFGKIYLRTLQMARGRVPSMTEREYDMNDFLNSAQTQEIAVSAVASADTTVWLNNGYALSSTTAEEVNAVLDKLASKNQSRYNAASMRVFIRMDDRGDAYEFHPVSVAGLPDSVRLWCICMKEGDVRLANDQITVMTLQLLRDRAVEQSHLRTFTISN